ncbi:MAG TPA: hypothetical protein VGJ27_09830, partial [Gaiellaceae bacterium]
RTSSVAERGAALRRDLLAASTKPGNTVETLVVGGRPFAGRYVYVNVFLGPQVASAAYSLSLAPARP